MQPAPELGGEAPELDEALGGEMKHVIRTRMFVADVSKWEEVARVHGEVFANIRPARSRGNTRR